MERWSLLYKNSVDVMLFSARHCLLFAHSEEDLRKELA